MFCVRLPWGLALFILCTFQCRHSGTPKTFKIMYLKPEHPFIHGCFNRMIQIFTLEVLVQPIKHPFKTGRLEFRVDYVSFAGTPNFARIVWPLKKILGNKLSRSWPDGCWDAQHSVEQRRANSSQEGADRFTSTWNCEATKNPPLIQQAGR